MHFSNIALVLAINAVAHVAAQPAKHMHNHARLHQKKDAEALKVEADVEKRQGWEDIDWATVSITYSAGQTWGEATSVAAPVASATTEAAVVVEATSTAASTPAATTPAASSVVAASSSAVSSSAAAVSTGTSTSLTSADETILTNLGCKIGTNAVSNDGEVWIGTDGATTNTYTNAAAEDIILVLWGAAGSWVNANTPLITLSLAQGESTTLSFADGVSGAWTAVYDGTGMVDGQISNTWGEFTTGEWGVVDVSREVNMNGNSMSIQTPNCLTDMETCVFTCTGGLVSCLTEYQLENCANGSQAGANFGTYDGADSGGCNMGGSSTSLTTTFS